ncbi:MAG TPA: hypothetical protein VM490_25480 [Armatimonadaceae bacterium]|nr:hypothetical protein [Armatimonadaceae bacterium]
MPLIPLRDAGFVRMMIALGLAMAGIFAGVIFVGKSIAFLAVIPFALCIVAVAARDQAVAVFLYLGYAAMEGMFKYLSNFSQVVYMVAPAMLAAIAVAWGLSRRARSLSGNPPPLTLGIALFAGIAFIQAMNPYGGGFVPGLATAFLWYIGPLLMYLVGCTAVRSLRQITALLYALVVISVVTSLIGIFQYQKGEEWVLNHLPGYESTNSMRYVVTDDAGKARQGGFRPASTFSQAGAGGSVAQFGVLAALGLLFVTGMPKTRKALIAVSLPINAVALMIYGTRLFVVSAIFMVVLFFILQARSQREMINSVVGLILFSVVSAVGFTTAQFLTDGVIVYRFKDTLANPLERYQQERGQNLTFLLKFIEQYPLGIGYQRGLSSWDERNVSGSTIDTNRETQFNCLQGDTGLPGLLVMIGICTGLTVRGWRAMRSVREPRLRTLGSLLFVILCGHHVTWFVGPVLQGAVLFWFTGGILIALPLIERRELQALEAMNRGSGVSSRAATPAPAAVATAEGRA